MRQRGTFHLLIPCLETRVQSQVSGGGDGDLPAEGEDGDDEPDAGRDAGEAVRVRTEQEEQPHLPRHSAGPSGDHRGVGNVLELNTGTFFPRCAYSVFKVLHICNHSHKVVTNFHFPG